jgi:GT2 family glycosyltransferase
MIAIITPWLNQPQLIPAYAAATEGALRVVVDTGSDDATLEALSNIGMVIKSDVTPFSYAAACNWGLEHIRDCFPAVTHAVCLNNDISGDPAWLQQIAALPDGVLGGAERIVEYADNQPLVYLSGWCVGATMATWDALKGWDATTYTGSYHEDVDLSWRAARLGIALRLLPLGLKHLGNTTSRATPGAYDHHAANRQAFLSKVRGAAVVAAREATV